MTERRRILFSGEVQGVGFRATAQRLARGLGLNGWVRNLPDGCVELVLDAEPVARARLLDALAREFTIARVDVSPLSPDTAVPPGFSIRA